MKLFSVIGLLTVALFASAAKINSDTLTLGKDTDTNVIRVEDGKLQFSNDGSNYKPFGSGSGGGTGINLIEDNADFESGTTGWTASGGTLAEETVDFLFGEKSLSWDSDASAQTLQTALLSITKGYVGNTCQLAFNYTYASGSSGDIEVVIRVYDDSEASESDYSVHPLNVTANRTPVFIPFSCPSDVNDDLRIRFQSTVADAGEFIVDDTFIGTGRQNFGVPANVVTRKYLTGDVTSDGTLPTLTFSDLVVGKTYEIRGAIGANITTGTDNVTVSAIHDGNTVARASISLAASAAYSQFPLSGRFTATTTSLTFSLSSVGGTTTILGDGSAALTYVDLEKRNDLDGPKEALTIETAGFYVAGTLGNVTSDLSFATVASETVINNSSLVLNQTGGRSGAVQIACDGAPSTGTSCLGSEQVGVTVNFPYAGKFMGCFDFSHDMRTSNAGGYVQTYFHVGKTAEGSDVILEKSDVINLSAAEGEASGSTIAASSHSNCHVYDIQTLRRSFKIFYTQNYNASADTNRLMTNVSFKFYPVNQQFPMPIFTELQESLDSKIEGQKEGVEKVCHGLIEVSSGTPAIGESAECVQSLTDVAAGRTTVTFSSGYFSSTPTCVCSPSNSGGNTACQAHSATSTAFSARTTTASTAADGDYDFSFVCVGAK